MIPMTSNVALAGRAFRSAKLAASSSEEHDRGHPSPCVDGLGTQQVRTLRAGESLFLQGDTIRRVCILREGWAFRYQTLEDGRRQIVDFVLPGDILGVEASSQMRYGVETLSPCTWITMSRDAFIARLSREPALAMKLVNLLSAAQVRAFEQMTSVGRRTARERVAHLLLDLARRTRRSASPCEGVEITMPLMLSHIGDALGLATETVCRCLGDLRRAGVLVFSAGRLEILDLRGLSGLAGMTVEDEDDDRESDRRLVA
jgi:CRP-like cAMP-binding protein